MGKKSKNESSGSWFEVVAHSDSLGRNVIEIPNGQRYTVRGPIDDVMVIMVSQKNMKAMMEGDTFESTMEALATTVRGGGFDGGLLIVPEGLGFMKLSPVNRVTAKLLEQRDQRQKAEYQTKIEKIKKEQEGEMPDNVTPLRPDTKTIGEA